MINKKQKTICLIVTVIIIASCWFLTPNKTAYAATSGDFEYSVNPDGASVTITGYTGIGGVISIPDTVSDGTKDYTVTMIGVEAFSNIYNVTCVTMPESIVSIGQYAFYRCNGLKSILISKNVTFIDQTAFFQTHGLEQINVSADNLNYTSENGILFNKTKSCLLQYPINNSKDSYTMPNTVTVIEERAFQGSHLSSISLSNALTTIKTGAFVQCTSLESITLPSGLTEIGDLAFFFCTDLETITIPDSVKTIGSMAFSECFHLAEINVGSGNNYYTSRDYVLFDKGITELLQYPPSNPAVEYSVPFGITTVAAQAFRGCRNLKKLNIPSSVTKIEDSNFTDDIKLELINVAEGNQNFASRNGVLFNKEKTKIIKYPSQKADTTYAIPESVKEIQDYAFSYCINLNSVTIPYGITKVSTSAFSDCYRLSHISIPESVTEIEAYAFQDCVQLQAIRVPSSLEKIYYGAFERCESLNSVYFEGNAPVLYSDAFKDCSSRLTMYYLKGTSGFTNPWYGYPSQEYDPTLISNPTVRYQTHVQNIGWQGWKTNGEVAGTSGQSLRLEGMNIEIDGMPDAIEYRTHVQDIGWQGWVRDGEMTGTSGCALRLEAIEIRLTGYMAANYDIYYRVHAQNIGWMDWAKNGQSAGTAGLSYRLEAIQIQLVPKGGAAPGWTAVPFKDANGPMPTNPPLMASVRYQTHVQNIGWQGWRTSGEVAGTSGQSLRLEGMYIDVQGADNAIEYRTHVQDIGWQNWVNEGEMTGTSGRSLRLEAIEIRLKGDMAENYDIYYRVHAQNIGWMDWAKNGQSAGTAGLSYRLEAIQIVIVQKGSAAPGLTARPFVSA